MSTPNEPTIDERVSAFTLKDISETMKMDLDTFIERYNRGELVLLDVRMPFETAVWGLKFAREIPYNQLPEKLDTLPRDKTIVCACPVEYRSNMAKEYLRFKGFDARTLDGGLLGLMGRLKGGKAKEIQIA